MPGGVFRSNSLAEAIAQKLELLNQDRDLLDHMSASAAQRAREFTWQAYRSLLATTLTQILANRT